MAIPGQYRLELPSPPAIEFTSPEGKQLFHEALQSGTMEGFFKLISCFQTQSEPAYCGLASLSVVLNALAIDPARKWKGPWRWFDESMLDVCEPLEKVQANGITFGKVVCLGRCAGAKVDAFRTNESTIGDFRKHIITCTSSDDCHLIASYHRRLFRQTGSGHFSPIGGYHARKDMALILDVARFKYSPHWVPLTRLWKAMGTIDKATGHHRGFMLISRFQKAPSLLYTLSCKYESWISTAKYLIDDVPVLLTSEDIKNVEEVLSVLFTSLPSNVEEFIKWVAEVCLQEEGGSNLSKEEKERLSIKEELLRQVHETELYKHVTQWLSSASPCCQSISLWSDKDALPEIAVRVCCQGAELLSGRLREDKGFCCSATRVKCLKANGDLLKTVVSGIVVTGDSEQGVDMLVPFSPNKQSVCCSPGLCNYVGIHPASSDVLTALLLALPPCTWSGIKDEHMLAEVSDLMSTGNLPVMLQEEVLHLRRQLHFLKSCQDNKVDEDLEPTKEQEMQNGFQTDVKHVAHIGWDDPSVNPPSWMNEFRTVPEFSSAPLSIMGEAKEPSPIKSASQDLNHAFAIQGSPVRNTPEVPRPSRCRLSSSTPHDSSTKKQSRHHQSAGNSINSSVPDLSGNAPKPLRRHQKAELSSQDPLRVPRKSCRKKSKGSSGNDGGSATSKALNSVADSRPDLEDIEKLRALDLKEDERV